MATITISKKEYQELLEKKLKYEHLREVLAEDIFSPPPTKSKKTVLSVFKTTKRYNKKFLDGLEKGLKRSQYFKA